MEEKSTNKKMIILLVVLLVTILIAIIGLTYAYFSVLVEGNEDASSMLVVRGAKLQITYKEEKNIIASSITPGWSETKSFTITNTGNDPTEYGIYWDNVVNTLVNKQYLVYTIESTGEGAYSTDEQMQFPSESGEYIVANIPIEKGVTHSYIITITYLNDTSFDQSDDMGKTFSASLEIETYEVSQE